MEPDETSIARQLLWKHVSPTTPNNGALLRDCVFCGFSPKLYNEDQSSAELELRQSLNTAVESDSEEMARKELGSDSETYKSVARIRLLKTNSTSVCVTVNSKVCR
jgi:hypothetical protein